MTGQVEMKSVLEAAMSEDGGVIHIGNVMNQFKCHKIVRAAKISEILDGSHGLSVMLQHPDVEEMTIPYVIAPEMMARYTPQVGDYVVLYDGDYVGISPKSAFESGYSPVPIVDEQDTEQIGVAVEQIAKKCHEINRAYCSALGDTSQLHWEQAPEWQRQSAINGVKFHIEHPDAGPDASHNSWLEEKRSAGWKFGAVKDADKKEHPCFVPYDQLPAEQKAKDYLFKQTVDLELGRI